MKNKVLSCLAVLGSLMSSLPLAHANPVAEQAAVTGQTPYELLKSLYENGKPAKRTDIPTEAECVKGRKLLTLNIRVSETTKQSELLTGNTFTVLMDASGTIPGKLGTPGTGAGPLFAGTPPTLATPARQVVFPVIGGSSCAEKEKIIPRPYWVLDGYSIEERDDALVVVNGDSTDSYRLSGNLIIVKGTYKDAKSPSFYYLWPAE